NPHAFSVFSGVVEVCVLVQAALGRKSRQARRSSWTRSPLRTDADSGARCYGPAFTTPVIHGRSERQVVSVLGGSPVSPQRGDPTPVFQFRFACLFAVEDGRGVVPGGASSH